MSFSETPWARPRPCYQLQSLSLFIQDIIHSGQIPQLAHVHAFNPSLRSFPSLSDECRDFLLPLVRLEPHRGQL